MSVFHLKSKTIGFLPAILLFAFAWLVSPPGIYAQTPPAGETYVSPVFIVYSVDKTPIERLVADPATKAILDRQIPGLTSEAGLRQFKSLTLRQLAEKSEGTITPEKLAAIQAEFELLPGVPVAQAGSPEPAIAAIQAKMAALFPAAPGVPSSAPASGAAPVPVVSAPPAAKHPRGLIAPRRFITKHEGTFAGQKIRYTVDAGDTVIRDASEEAIGSIFSFSYIMDDVGSASQRPVLFIFNGGPGSSSVWLHMGVLGPRRVDLQGVNGRQTPPFGPIDNPDSVLAVADLVFIDPIGTGFSRYYGNGTPEDFYGVQEDAGAVIQFIEHWLNSHKRWDSPKFILGESYGTVRANVLAKRLMGGVADGVLRGINLNGVILVGGEGGLEKAQGEERYQIGFSTMAATAWYHERVDRAGRSLEQFTAEADKFAAAELIPALKSGDALSPAEKTRLAKTISGFIGLSESYILSKNLRIDDHDFGRQLLADKGLLVGNYDSRYTLPLAGSADDPVADDPAMGQYTPPFAGAFNTYIRTELGVDIDESYILIAFKDVNFAWKDNGGDTGADLVTAMRRNPQLRLMSAQGWFDLGGAVGSAEYGIAQRGLPADRVTSKHYASGHMCYVGETGKIMAADLREFIVKASAGR
jgi:carboxypeptidase C (cathepsin A)